MLTNKSADATHRFQPFQSSSELVEKVDQPNQPKTVFPQYNTKKLNQPNQLKRLIPKEHGLSNGFCRHLIL